MSNKPKAARAPQPEYAKGVDPFEYRIIRSAKGQPTLLTIPTANYSPIYNDSGSGSHRDGAFYRPTPTDPSFFIVGDYAQGNYGGPVGPTIVVKSLNDDGNPLLAPPSGWREVWNDHGSGGHQDGSIWAAVPPDGYVAIGFVCQAGYDTPNIPNYRCVRADFTASSEAGALIWDDSGSGAHDDVAVYQNAGVAGVFVAQGDYAPFNGQVYSFIKS